MFGLLAAQQEPRAGGRTQSPLGIHKVGKQQQGAAFGVALELRHCTERGKDQECERRHQRAPRQLRWPQVGGQMPGLVGTQEMLLGAPDAQSQASLATSSEKTNFFPCVLCTLFTGFLSAALAFQLCTSSEIKLLLLLISPEVIR